MRFYRVKIRHLPLTSSRAGFTLIELLVGSSIMLIIILGALSLYIRSNRISVDQNQLTELQHDVRSSMFFIARDIRSTGVGASAEIGGYFLEGKDGFSPSSEASDSIKIMGNFDRPLRLRIRQYQEGTEGSPNIVSLYDSELENSPYDCPDYYENRIYLVISSKCPGCFAFRFVPNDSVLGCGTGKAQLVFEPGISELDPPGSLIDTGCGADCWDDGIVTVGQIKQYWLDATGNPGDYPEFDLSRGEDGYLGIPNVLYLTTTNQVGEIIHMPIATNIENLQFQYRGDLDNDGFLDEFVDWDNANWTVNPTDNEAAKQTKLEIISRIRQVKIWILGKTSDPFVSVSGPPPSNLHLYRRPAIANSPQGNQIDLRRRFLLETTASIRNLSLNIYNTGTR